ncbi:MAG: hypothetical protein WC389_08020 [Lutibacter sp.]|jgi:hypothetical protein
MRPLQKKYCDDAPRKPVKEPEKPKYNYDTADELHKITRFLWEYGIGYTVDPVKKTIKLLHNDVCFKMSQAVAELLNNYDILNTRGKNEKRP